MSNVINFNAYKMRKLFEKRLAEGRTVPLFVIWSKGTIHGQPGKKLSKRDCIRKLGKEISKLEDDKNV